MDSWTDRTKAIPAYIIIGVFYVATVLSLPSILFPGPPKPRDLAELTIAGRISSLILCMFGYGVAPEYWGFSPLPEIKLLLINPGLYAGIAIGFLSGRIGASLYPMGAVLLLCILFAFIPGGIWMVMGLVPIVIITAVYAPIGALIGKALRRLFNGRSDDTPDV